MARSKQDGSGYNRFKRHGGAGYTGMKIGGTHKWHYDRGEWKERKITPDEWSIFYQTKKRRAGKAPERSGAPVGTKYNWLIVSHQRVDKLDANSYMTYMEGKKFKVAHQRASKGTWSIPEKKQREKVIAYLEQVIEEIKQAGEDDRTPYTTREHARVYGLEHKTVKELSELASDLEIPNRSKMRRQELLEAVRERVDVFP